MNNESNDRAPVDSSVIQNTTIEAEMEKENGRYPYTYAADYLREKEVMITTKD